MTSEAAPLEHRSAARRAMAPLALVGGLAVAAAGLSVLLDRNGGPLLLAALYDLLGNQQAAELLRLGSGDRTTAKVLLTAVALSVGVGGVWLIYTGLNWLIERLGPRWQSRLVPWLFVGPAIALLGVYLVYPVIQTLLTSVTEGGGFEANYGYLTQAPMQRVLRNNLYWLVVATGGSVILGLVIAFLFDRVRFEALAKTFVFLPLAISLVGASVIWKFVYAWAPPNQAQYGLLNAMVTEAGGAPVNWLQAQGAGLLGELTAFLPTVLQSPGMNTYALIVIMVWLQTGFAMVVLSAAIKGVSSEIIEAARLDGASERQLFFQVIVPIIKGSIITVTTTIAIVVLKIFDVVYVTTGGRFDSDVVANRMFQEMFTFFNDGRASALAVVLFLAVLPIMVINVRNLRRQGIDA
jgi:alpha-glucoside transport system permease protein